MYRDVRVGYINFENYLITKTSTNLQFQVHVYFSRTRIIMFVYVCVCLQEETQLMSESERATWVKRYTLPSTPHIIVHPSKTSKSGKFECNLVSLHSLLVYHSDFVKVCLHFFLDLI